MTLLIALMWPILALSGGIIRVVATLLWAVRTPLKTLREMPKNWLRQAFCTDSYYPPEIVPGEEVAGGNVISPRFRQIANLCRGGEGLKARALLAGGEGALCFQGERIFGRHEFLSHGIWPESQSEDRGEPPTRCARDSG